MIGVLHSLPNWALLNLGPEMTPIGNLAIFYLFSNATLRSFHLSLEDLLLWAVFSAYRGFQLTNYRAGNPELGPCLQPHPGWPCFQFVHAPVDLCLGLLGDSISSLTVAEHRIHCGFILHSRLTAIIFARDGNLGSN